MNKVIYKYPIGVDEVEIPKDAEILKFGIQSGSPMLWAMLVPGLEQNITRKIRIFATGQAIPMNAKYIDTFFDEPFVWHVCEIL